MNIKRALRFWWQRRTRGWDDSDTWDLDHTLARWLAPRLRRFREIMADKNEVAGIPGSYLEFDATGCHVTNEEGALKAWWADLDKMIDALERYDRFDVEETAEDGRMIEDGVQLLAKHFRDLWW